MIDFQAPYANPNPTLILTLTLIDWTRKCWISKQDQVSSLRLNPNPNPSSDPNPNPNPSSNPSPSPSPNPKPNPNPNPNQIPRELTSQRTSVWGHTTPIKG